jgi:hypothetical protein
MSALLELSRTGTHLNIVLGGQDDPQPVESELAAIKTLIDAKADSMICPHHSATGPDGRLRAPDLPDDAWNADPGTWNLGKGTKPYGSKRRLRQRRVVVDGGRDTAADTSAAAAPRLPVGRLTRRSPAPSDIEKVRNEIAGRLSTLQLGGLRVDEHGRSAVWDASDSLGHGGGGGTKKAVDPVRSEFRNHLQEAKARALAKRKQGLQQIQPYLRSVEQREHTKYASSGRTHADGAGRHAPPGTEVVVELDTHGLTTVTYVDTAANMKRMRALKRTPMGSWTAAQVTQWVGLLSAYLTADEIAVATATLGGGHVDGAQLASLPDRQLAKVLSGRGLSLSVTLSAEKCRAMVQRRNQLLQLQTQRRRRRQQQQRSGDGGTAPARTSPIRAQPTPTKEHTRVRFKTGTESDPMWGSGAETEAVAEPKAAEADAVATIPELAPPDAAAVAVSCSIASGMRRVPRGLSAPEQQPSVAMLSTAQILAGDGKVWAENVHRENMRELRRLEAVENAERRRQGKPPMKLTTRAPEPRGANNQRKKQPGRTPKVKRRKAKQQSPEALQLEQHHQSLSETGAIRLERGWVQQAGVIPADRRPTQAGAPATVVRPKREHMTGMTPRGSVSKVRSKSALSNEASCYGRALEQGRHSTDLSSTGLLRREKSWDPTFTVV